MNQRRIFIIASLLLFAIVVAGVFWGRDDSEDAPSTATTTAVVRCDTDAKVCPDGSTVFREGTACEFAACPSLYGDEAAWQTGKDEALNLTFRYPATLGTNFVTARDWPPTFSVVKNDFTCVEQAVAGEISTSTTQMTFNGVNYCIAERKEGAAGSVYSTYVVTFPKGVELLAMHFTLQRVQCGNYEGSEQSACEAAQNDFKVIELVHAIASSIER